MNEPAEHPAEKGERRRESGRPYNGGDNARPAFVLRSAQRHASNSDEPSHDDAEHRMDCDASEHEGADASRDGNDSLRGLLAEFLTWNYIAHGRTPFRLNVSNGPPACPESWAGIRIALG